MGGEPLGLGIDVGHVDVEVHAVLRRLRLRDALEQELGCAGVVAGWEQQHVGTCAADDAVAERRRPEARQGVGVGAVEDEAELGHLAMLARAVAGRRERVIGSRFRRD